MKAGTRTILTGVVIFLLGAVGIPLVVILSFIFTDSNEIQFKVPGRIQYTIKEPGRYYLWNEYQTIFDGLSYNRSTSIPDGIRITIRDTQTGSLYDFEGNTSISSSGGASAKNSIGYIEAKDTGSIIIDITGGIEERIFSFSKFGFWDIFGRIFGGIGLAFLVCIVGGGLVALGIIKLSKSNRANP